jgi:hypothetical protein
MHASTSRHRHVIQALLKSLKRKNIGKKEKTRMEYTVFLFDVKRNTKSGSLGKYDTLSQAEEAVKDLRKQKLPAFYSPVIKKKSGSWSKKKVAKKSCRRK